MESLRCTMADHESQGKIIIGICTDVNCKATQRILCMICQTKFHNMCQRDTTLDKGVLLEKLKDKLKIQISQRPLDQLHSLRVQINKTFDQLEKGFQILEKNQNTLSIERLQELAKTPFTMNFWNECYSLLEQKEENPQMVKITGCLEQIQQLLGELSTLASPQANKIKEPQKEVTQIYQKNISQIPNESIESIDCSPCGKYIICAGFYIIIKFDLIQYKRIREGLKLHTGYIFQVKYSLNGLLIASCSCDNTIIFWEASTLTQIGKTIKGHQKSVYSIAFSPDSSRLVSGSYDQTIKIWNCSTQEQIGECIKTGYHITSVQYSPNGLQILSAGLSGNIHIWNPTTGQLIKLIGHNDNVNSATYSLDGRLIVSCGEDKLIKVWDATTGSQIGNDLIGHKDGITSVTFSPDSSLIVSGSKDKTVRLWNFATYTEECILHTHDDTVKTVRFTKYGKQVVSGSNDKTISLVKI